MQIKIPRLHEAHRGWPVVLQSAQNLLEGSLSSDFRICWFFSFVTFFWCVADPAADLADDALYDMWAGVVRNAKCLYMA